MFTELFNLVRANSQESVQMNDQVPAEKKGAVIAETTISLLHIFRNQGSDNMREPLYVDPDTFYSELYQKLSDRLIKRLGLNSFVASSVTVTLIPVLIDKLEQEKWIVAEQHAVPVYHR